MKVRAKFYADFKKLFGDEKEVELGDQANMRDLLARLCDSEQRRQIILDEAGKVKPSVMVLLKRGVRSEVVDKEYTELENGDMVMVFRAVYGG